MYYYFTNTLYFKKKVKFFAHNINVKDARTVHKNEHCFTKKCMSDHYKFINKSQH